MITSITNFNYWIFDLDNTLYPAKFSLMPQISRRIGEYIMANLSLEEQAAKALQKKYYLEHGTSLRGLMLHHGVDADDFMHFVHDIDYSLIPENKPLAQLIHALPGKKYIHTNATKAHCDKVLSQLALHGCFDGIFDVADSDYVPKPELYAHQTLIEQFSIQPEQAVMIEDLPQNLKNPAKLGMKTVLITSDYHDHQNDFTHDADYIHHKIHDLGGWLQQILKGV